MNRWTWISFWVSTYSLTLFVASQGKVVPFAIFVIGVMVGFKTWERQVNG